MDARNGSWNHIYDPFVRQTLSFEIYLMAILGFVASLAAVVNQSEHTANFVVGDMIRALIAVHLYTGSYSSSDWAMSRVLCGVFGSATMITMCMRKTEAVQAAVLEWRMHKKAAYLYAVREFNYTLHGQ
jgi:hypothetical protein